jgi:hypothetical protein
MKKLILSAAVLAMVFVGCKKEDTKPSDSSSTSSTPRISKEISYYESNQVITDSSITTYTYDSKERLISTIVNHPTGFLASNIPWYSSTNYVYNSSNKITLHNYSSLNNIRDTIEYILDSKGLVIKYVLRKDFTDTLHITYSADGFMKGYKIGDKTQDLNVEIKDDNIIKQDNLTFEYYLDKTSTIRNINRGINFLGKESKNLIQSEKYTQSNPDVFLKNSESTYTYQFDSKNRVIKSISTTLHTNGSNVKTTKYQYIN